VRTGRRRRAREKEGEESGRIAAWPKQGKREVSGWCIERREGAGRGGGEDAR
jgi:hypothetical protein